MVRGEPLHLGHAVASYLSHQGQYARVGVIFAGPFITRLAMGLGWMDAIRGVAKETVPAPLGIETLLMMGLVRRAGPGVYRLVPPQAAAAAAAAEGSQAIPQAEPEAPPQEPAPEAQRETEAPDAAPAPPGAPTPTTRADDRFERLEGAVGAI